MLYVFAALKLVRFEFPRLTMAAATILLGLASNSSFAVVPGDFTYQGRMYNEAGTAPRHDQVVFEFTVTDPSGACVLYQETSAIVDLSSTDGLVAVQVGAGTPTATAGVNTFSSLSQVFANSSSGAVGSHPRPTN